MKQIPVNFAFSGKVANIEFHGGALNGIDRDKLTMFSASETEDGVFVPANSFTCMALRLSKNYVMRFLRRTR